MSSGDPKTKLLVPVCTLFLMAGCAGLHVERAMKIAQADWVTYGGAPSRTNQASTEAVPPFVEMWQHNTVAGILATPLVRDSVIILATLNGEIQTVNLLNGKRTSYAGFDAPIAGTPVWNGSNIFVPISSSNHSIVSVSLRNSERFWSVALGPIESSPLLLGKQLYVTTLEGKAHCLNADDGSEIWQFKTWQGNDRKPIRSSPASDGETVFFGCDDGAVYALGAKERNLRWRFETKGRLFATPIVFESKVVVGSLDGFVYCLRSETGELIWSFDTKSVIYGSASTSGKKVFVGTADGKCYALDVTTGFPVWSASTKSGINTAPLVAGNTIYVGSLDRTLRVLDAESGKDMWQYSAPGRIKVSPVFWRNTLLVISEDRLLIAFTPEKK